MSHRRNSPDHVHEADQPDMVLALFDADGLAGEDLAEVDLFVQKPHPTLSGHPEGPLRHSARPTGKPLPKLTVVAPRQRRRLNGFRPIHRCGRR